MDAIQDRPAETGRSMSDRYLLDTNIISEIVRQGGGSVVLDRITGIGETNICTSAIVASELRYGAAKKGSELLSEKVERALRNIDIQPYAARASHTYGTLRTSLVDARGRVIGANDILIAAMPFPWRDLGHRQTLPSSRASRACGSRIGCGPAHDRPVGHTSGWAITRHLHQRHHDDGVLQVPARHRWVASGQSCRVEGAPRSMSSAAELQSVQAAIKMKGGLGKAPAPRPITVSASVATQHRDCAPFGARALPWLLRCARKDGAGSTGRRASGPPV